MSDPEPIPKCRHDFKTGHHIVHHTFLPWTAVCIGLVAGGPALWLLGHVNYHVALASQWGAIAGVCAYIALLGGYVMPRETYRNYRAGRFGNRDCEQCLREGIHER